MTLKRSILSLSLQYLRWVATHLPSLGSALYLRGTQVELCLFLYSTNLWSISIQGVPSLVCHSKPMSFKRSILSLSLCKSCVPSLPDFQALDRLCTYLEHKWNCACFCIPQVSGPSPSTVFFHVEPSIQSQCHSKDQSYLSSCNSYLRLISIFQAWDRLCTYVEHKRNCAYFCTPPAFCTFPSNRVAFEFVVETRSPGAGFLRRRVHRGPCRTIRNILEHGPCLLGIRSGFCDAFVVLVVASIRQIRIRVPPLPLCKCRRSRCSFWFVLRSPKTPTQMALLGRSVRCCCSPPRF